MRRKKKTGVMIVLVVVALLALAVDAVLMMDRFVWVAGGLHAVDESFLDLRGKNISLSEYQEITKKLPDARIVWNVPVQGSRYSSDSRELTMDSFSEADIPLMDCFPGLTTLHAEKCRDYSALDAFGAQRPECRIIYGVDIGSQSFTGEAETIAVDNADTAALSAGLKRLPAVTSVEFTGALPDGAALMQLRQDYPDITFHWQVEWEGKPLPCTTKELDLSGRSVDFNALKALADRLPELETVDVRGSLTEAQLIEISKAYPNCFFRGEITLAGMTFDTALTEMDLSGNPVTTAEVEAVLPCFHKLERVNMSNCGPSDEEMDALNQKYENIRFVWSVHIRNVELQTDAKYFYPFKFYSSMIVDEEDLYPLRYCTDLEAIDIGHMTGVKTCDWLYYMPNMKYLVIVETAITDITPIASLKNLVFLEIFTTGITDYSPLLECTSLEDLNLGRTYGDPAPILKMTWLKNLWWSGIEGTVGLICSDAPQRLRETLTNTNMKFNLATPNVDNGWRQLDNYKAMRELMDVFCLT